MFLKHKRARPYLAGGITCIALTGQWMLLSWSVDNPDMRQAGGMYYSTLPYILIFLMNGVAGFASCRQNKYVVAVQKIKGLDILLVCICVILARMLYNVIWYPYLPKHMFVLIFTGLGIASSLFILRVSSSESSFCSSFLRYKPLVFLGQVSYGIFIWHIISKACLSAIFSKYLPKASGKLLFGYFILSILSAIIWGTASRLIIERPFLRLKEMFNN
jgi:peptidoglycan/LPS O-acetylase OafA/YrhL